MKLFFLGERPSPKALAMGVSWKHGRLAAKQLFEALRANNVEPATCRFDNAFLTDLGPERTKPWLRRTLTRATRRGETVVALGQKVSRILRAMGVQHIALVHPAARGRIRNKAAYAAHVRQQLHGNGKGLAMRIEYQTIVQQNPGDAEDYAVLSSKSCCPEMVKVQRVRRVERREEN